MSIREIPINKGSMPDWNKRFGNPELFNMFVGESGFPYCTPGLKALALFENGAKVWFTPFRGGSFIVVTKTSVIRVSLDGAITFIQSIVASGQPVQIAENLQNQVGIADGRFAYVFDQRAATFTKLSSVSNNFDIANPISVTTVNSFMIWLGENGEWIPSSPNNALLYDAEQANRISSALTSAKGVSSIYNNLFIFGLTGIERWEATLQTNVYLRPFQRDNNFEQNFGALSTNCIVNAINRIYFLSSLFVPMALTSQGIVELPQKSDKEPKTTTGWARIISELPDKERVAGSFYSFRGNYFFQMTFQKENFALVYNQNSNTMHEVDDIIISSAKNNEVVLTPDGLYRLDLSQNYKRRSITLPRVTLYKGQKTTRNLLNGVEIRIAQGYSQSIEPQDLELSLSLDSESWMNVIRIPIGKTGKRNNLAIWRSNVAFQYEITPKIEYFGSYNFNIEKFTLDIN